MNFFNTNDYALNVWTTDQNLKSQTDELDGFIYASGQYVQNAGLIHLYFPNDAYTIFSRIIQARCYAVGAQADMAGPFTGNEVELDAAPYNFGTQHIYHSAEFRSDNAQRWQFWDSVLANFGVPR